MVDQLPREYRHGIDNISVCASKLGFFGGRNNFDLPTRKLRPSRETIVRIWKATGVFRCRVMT